jgi:hypothetical protein
MSINGRLDRIDKQIAAYAGGDEPAELKKIRAQMFEPSAEQQHDAIAAILQTMPEGYQQIVIADLLARQDSPEKIEPKPITLRVEELAWLRLYECPRPLALPEEFCRAFEELKGDDELRWDWHACGSCLLAHPTLVPRPLYQGNQQRPATLFYKCVSCGETVTSMLSPEQAPCHDTVGSPYRRAWANLPPRYYE